MKYDTAIVIGAGAFGTSIASVISNNFKKVLVKVREKEVYQSIKDKSENLMFLPGHKLSSNIIPAYSWEELNSLMDGKVQLIVSGLPTTAIRPFCDEHFEELKKLLDLDVPFVSLAKGIDSETLELPDDLFFSYYPKHRDQMCFLSGPSFAKEIIEKQITLVSLAGRNRNSLLNIAEMLQTDFFKANLSFDIKGVLLGGALKNVLAIGGGIIEGLGYNYNTRAAMITQGIYEMLRFGKVFNARPETFYGLSGMGDLILTTTGDLSRNKTFGQEIAKGRTPQEIIDSQHSVVEGYKTAKGVKLLAEKYAIRCRVFQGIYNVLYEDAKPKDVIHELMRSPTKFEIE